MEKLGIGGVNFHIQNFKDNAGTIENMGIDNVEQIRRQKDAEAARFEAEQRSLAQKAEAQRKMGEASVLEMYLTALPEVVRNAAAPLAQTDKIVMYGDGNSTRLVRDVMSSANQIMDGMKESTGIDLAALLTGMVGARMVTQPAEPQSPAAS